jgi:hypothetical protein
MRYVDMLIDTAYNLSDIEDRTLKPGHPSENRCTFCVRQRNYSWYPIEDVRVVRTWRKKSIYQPELPGADGGGWYSWRCPDHAYDGKPSSYAEEAPEHLRPKYTHRCQARILSSGCGEPAVGFLDDRWMCSDHARPILLRLRQEEVLNGEPFEIKDPNLDPPA